MTINGDYEIKLFTGETDCVQFLGYYEAGETVIVRLESDKVKVGADAFYLLDETAFGKAMATLKENSLNISDWSSGYIEGSINVSDDGCAFTSLVYDEAWSVKVDGKEVDTYALKDGLLCFDITKGQHTVEIEYSVPGFAAGMVITCITLVGVLFVFLRKFIETLIK